ncbi:MAG: response regulator [Thermodesulfobacteriota bacterium]
MPNSKIKGFSGSIEGLTLVDLVQLACLEGVDRKLMVASGEDRGTIYFANSEIVHAEYGEKTGKEAFYDIMAWQSGAFSMNFDSTETRTVDSSWNFLLMEAVRRIDEQGAEKKEEENLTKVLVVDDSRLFTKSFVKLFEDEIGARVVGTATNGKEALKFLEVQVPDLVTLDINMPVMGGDVALKHIMIRSPAPVVLVSAFNEQICSKLMDFMRLGAVDVVAKPSSPESWKVVSERLRYIMTHVQEFRLNNISRAKNMLPVEPEPVSEMAATRLLLFISGLGGMLELQKIIPSLTYSDDTGVMILQNMYPAITEHLASYLDRFTPYSTTTLTSEIEIKGGQCHVGSCLFKYEISDDEGVPVVSTLEDEDDQSEFGMNPERLLESALDVYGSALTIVVLGGVEMDLRDGLNRACEEGAEVILQSPDSSLLPGPLSSLRAALSAGNVLKPEEIVQFLSANDGGS